MSLQVLGESKTAMGVSVSDLLEWTDLGKNETTVIGQNAAQNVISGDGNTVVGFEAQGAITAVGGDRLTLIGSRTGFQNQGDNNTFVGADAGGSNLTGERNAFFGASSGLACEAGSANVCVGSGSGQNSTGSANTYVGALSGRPAFASSASSSNTALGHGAQAGGTPAASGALALGAGSVARGARTVAAGHNVACYARDSVVVGSGLATYGADALLLQPRGSVFDWAAQDEALNVYGALLGQRVAGEFATSLRGDTVGLHASAGGGALLMDASGVTVASACNVTVKAPLAARCNVDMGPGARVGYCDAAGARMWTAGLDASERDLVFEASDSTRVVFTQDFATGVVNFTGSHLCRHVLTPAQLASCVGKIVVATGAYNDLDGGEAPTLDESVPVVALSAAANARNAFGVVSAVEGTGAPGATGTATRSFDIGNVSFQRARQLDDHRLRVNSCGEGAVLVCADNGPIANGDLITTSAREGVGMRQGTDAVMCHTVAKATCDCSFDAGDVRLIGCVYKF